MNRRALTRFAWLSIAAAVATIALKTGAYLLTNSVGLLSDAMESVVNLLGATVALAMLIVAARPPDEEHAYGHSKAEYFASGFEGSLILVAALGIAVAALERFLRPRDLAQLGVGLAVSAFAALLNFCVARILLRAGRQYNSITLDADAQHLLTDVWTSAGVIVGLAAGWATGWHWLDPALALAVAVHILWKGAALVRRSALGLMDTALPLPEREAVQAVLTKYLDEGVGFHALRTRQSGARRFVSLHVLVPGAWTVHRGHELLEQIEAEIRAALPEVTVFTHLESLEDPASWEDTALDREGRLPPAATAGEESERGGTRRDGS